MTATDLVAWSKLIGFADQPALARCEIETFRYRVLHVAARISRGARQTWLRIDASWPWAQAIAAAGTASAPRSADPHHSPSPTERTHPASGTGAHPTRQSGHQPTPNRKIPALQHLSTGTVPHIYSHAKSRLGNEIDPAVLVGVQFAESYVMIWIHGVSVLHDDSEAGAFLEATLSDLRNVGSRPEGAVQGLRVVIVISVIRWIGS